MLAFMFFISRLLPVLTYELFAADVSFIGMLSTSTAICIWRLGCKIPITLYLLACISALDRCCLLVQMTMSPSTEMGADTIKQWIHSRFISWLNWSWCRLRC